jgi:tripartite-type tricarboxylate transporter receptor subunit TctC
MRMLLAAAPGVPSDTLGRALMEPLSKSLGVPVVMDNRVGADGIIGTEACAKAPPDGYTLCVTQSGQMIWNPVLRSNLPYDTLRDFVPVVHTVFFDSALMVHPSLKAASVRELFKLAQARPNKINWGHFGVNSTGYMYQEYFRKSRRAPFYAVPYKTQPQALQALLSGEVQVSLSSLASAAPHLKAGKIKALAVTADQRVGFLPKVPTFAEEGIKLPLRTWFGYHYQAGIPRAYVLRMNVEIRAALSSPGFKEKVLDRLGFVQVTGTPEEFDAYIRNQLKAVKELVTYLGIKPQ